jgi:ubiquinone biosynthesis protein
MEYLQALAQHFANRHHTYGFPSHLIPDTFTKVRRLLRHEVNFAREQKTLHEAARLYRYFPGVAIPAVIQPLCTRKITALTEEHGRKVTSVAARIGPAERRNIAEQILEALVAFPLVAADTNVIFHGDPHAGNLLYDRRTGKLVILDWALRERLSREQRRQLALLFLTISCRDPVGACSAVRALSQPPVRSGGARERAVRQTVTSFIDEMPLSHLAGGADVMKLLEQVALAGVRFPRPLIMLSKAMFTLDGVLADIDADGAMMAVSIARRVAKRWVTDRKTHRSPLAVQDWITLPGGVLLLPSRVWLRCERALLDRLLPARKNAQS